MSAKTKAQEYCFQAKDCRPDEMVVPVARVEKLLLESNTPRKFPPGRVFSPIGYVPTPARKLIKSPMRYKQYLVSYAYKRKIAGKDITRWEYGDLAISAERFCTEEWIRTKNGLKEMHRTSVVKILGVFPFENPIP